MTTEQEGTEGLMQVKSMEDLRRFNRMPPGTQAKIDEAIVAVINSPEGKALQEEWKLRDELAHPALKLRPEDVERVIAEWKRGGYRYARRMAKRLHEDAVLREKKGFVQAEPIPPILYSKRRRLPIAEEHRRKRKGRKGHKGHGR